MSVKKILSQEKMKALATASRALVRMNGERKRSLQMLEEVQNKYEGQRCFVIGNGPSLTANDLSTLKAHGEIVFASNRIYNIFKETDWRPDYYCMIDEGVGKTAARDYPAVECEMMFFNEEGYVIYRKMQGKKCYVHTWYERKYLDHPAFCEDLTEGAYVIASVTYFMLEIARYMGFSEIYLLGVDNSYKVESKQDGSIVVNSDIKKSYFGDQKQAEKTVVGSSWESNIAYGYAEKYSRSHGFRIYNATRGGKLEAFERVDFDSLFER